MAEPSIVVDVTQDIDHLGMGSHGYTLRITMEQDDAAQDVSSAEATYIEFVSPDNRYIRKTASFTTDGSDGNIEYDVEEDLINIPGVWRYRGRADFTSTGEDMILVGKMTEVTVEDFLRNSE